MISVLYAGTIFSSAFLLFLVQPIVSKHILPWFGGSAAVWSTCLVFFQSLLLLGYAYADQLSRRWQARTQVGLHSSLLILSALSLPVLAGEQWKPSAQQDPSLYILFLLAATVGLPYLMLSTTGPLIQTWAARSSDNLRVYRLFSLSNFASLLALMSYPLLIEPHLALGDQSSVWSVVYICFVVLCIFSGVALLQSRQAEAVTLPESALITETSFGAAEASKLTKSTIALWVGLSALGSWLLLAVSNHITQNIASIPFLWLLPLTLYLLSFVLCFESDRWYHRMGFLIPAFVLLEVCAFGLGDVRLGLDLKLALPLYCTGLFVLCMFLHGELAGTRPAPRYLTRFYLAISFGGALGGILVGLVAPRVLPAYYELGLGYVLVAMLAVILFWQRRLLRFTAMLLCLMAGFFLWVQVQSDLSASHTMLRNFYGRLLTRDITDPATGIQVRRLLHGSILHGEEYLSGSHRNKPTTYYGPSSGIGRVLAEPDAMPGRKVGVIGLGTGTLAAYGHPRDQFRFYDINPEVIAIARTEFGFLSQSQAQIETVLGDARLVLEAEAPNQFDVLVIDAFSGDSIPVHLITREALAVYRRHVKAGGIIAFHVSNRFLALAPVVRELALDQQLQAVLISDQPERPLLKTDWVLVSDSAQALSKPAIASVALPAPSLPGLSVWTDNANNLFKILK